MRRPLETSGFMRFFSFGKKDDTPRRRGAGARSARSGGAFEAREERRTRRAERAGDADAMLLDPTLPEKQRARRRLVGAIALVVAAVVVLPMVLDSHPKPLTDDIAIDIPNRPAVAPSRAGDDSDNPEATQEGVAPDQADTTDSANPSRSEAAGGGAAQAKAASQPAGSGQSHANASANAAKPAPASAATAKTERANAAQPDKPTTVPAPSAAQAESGTPAAPPGSRFAVQLGVFPDDPSARAWEKKLKAAGVPAYIEHSKQANGKTRTMLRAGPFADRAAASAAIAKVREAGLTANAGNAAQ